MTKMYSVPHTAYTLLCVEKMSEFMSSRLQGHVIAVSLVTRFILGCSSKAETTLDLLNAGSAKACIARDVTDQLVADVMPSPDWHKGPYAAQYPGVTFKITSASATSIKKDEHAIACEAVLSLSFDGIAPKVLNTFSVKYEIEPDLVKSGKFIVKANLPETEQNAIDLFSSLGIISYSSH